MVQKMSGGRVSISSNRPGRVVVDVSVQRIGTSENHSKQLTVDYSDVTRFDVFHSRATSLGATLPVIKGTILSWCATAYGTTGGTETGLYIKPIINTEPKRLSVDGTVLTVDATAKIQR